MICKKLNLVDLLTLHIQIFKMTINHFFVVQVLKRYTYIKYVTDHFIIRILNKQFTI